MFEAGFFDDVKEEEEEEGNVPRWSLIDPSSMLRLICVLQNLVTGS